MTTNDFLFLQDALVGKANNLLREIMTLVKQDAPQQPEQKAQETQQTQQTEETKKE